MDTFRDNDGVVVGVFEDRAAAQQAVRELRHAGFTEEQIGVVARDSAGGIENEVDGGNATAGAVAGAATGAGIGGLWALGIAAGVLPAIGPVIAGGIFASLLASAATGAAAGGVIGALMGAGVPDDEAEEYESQFEAGRTLVTVRHGGLRASNILRNAGAEVRVHGYQGDRDVEGPACDVSEAHGLRHDAETLKLREEELRVQKRPVETGKVTLRKEVVQENKTIDVPVMREEVVIERHPVNRSEGAGAISGASEEIRMPVREEEVSIDKRAVVKEEVSVGKRRVQDTKHVSADLKREELRVDEQGQARTTQQRSPK